MNGFAGCDNMSEKVNHAPFSPLFATMNLKPEIMQGLEPLEVISKTISASNEATVLIVKWEDE